MPLYTLGTNINGGGVGGGVTPPPPPAGPIPIADPLDGMLRSVVLDRIREQADAVGATVDWSPGLVLQFATEAFEDEWLRLLDTIPTFRTAVRSVTTDAQGRVAVAALSQNATVPLVAGVRTQRVHRVLDVQLERQRLEYVEPWAVQQFLAGTGQPVLVGSDYWWTLIGPALVCGLANATLTVTCNHRPALVRDVPDTGLVEWPGGRDMIPILEAAAMMLAKGGREVGEAQALRALAEERRREFYEQLQRRTIAAPRRVLPADDPSEWGGW